MWNTVRGVWEKPIRNIICEHSALFSEVWPTSGTMRNGLVFVRPTQVRLTDENVSLSLDILENSMLRTPTATEGEGGARREDTQRANGRMVYVRDQMAQLAVVNALPVMPTPTVSDSRGAAFGEVVKGNPKHRLKVEVELLGTPRTSSANGSTTSQRVAGATKGRLEDQVEGARDSYIDWGKFAPAIRRWEIVTGSVAPAPTNADGKDGTHRLSAAFTEWMMGLPVGWVTSVGLRRNEELKACGNGVVPQQAAMALRHLLGRLADA
jgi:DNA (cytosine-5)-methyltransferase 1